MSAASDAEVIGRSWGEPEAFGLIYDRHAAALLRFLGRRAGATVAEGLVGELFRIAFERRKTFDATRGSALPWLYGIGSNLLLKHRRAEARWLRASARMAAGRAARTRRSSAAALEARVLFSRVVDAIEICRRASARRSCCSRGRSSRTRTWPTRSSCRSARCARASTARVGAARTARAVGETSGEVAMKPLDLAKKLRRDAVFDPAALDQGKAKLMADIQKAVAPGAARRSYPRCRIRISARRWCFLEHAFGFHEIRSSRLVGADGVIHHANVEFGDGVIGIGTQGAHGALSPKSAGVASQYISVSVADVETHYQQAVAAGARIADEPHDEPGGVRAYEALDLEGHRWRFLHGVRELPRYKRRGRP